MPKVIYSAAKGLYQESGSGFQVNDVPILEEIQELSGTGALGALNPYGVTTLALTSGTPTATLAAPTSSEPAGTKKVITCASRSGGSCAITLTGGGIRLNGTGLATLTFDAAGETSVLISNGDKWCHVAKLESTEG
tara:strand:+ start:19138 stop:19545 length:408 start_codon:yes stop_codon:yes gene_type:complete